MSRLRKLTLAVVSSYAQLGVTALYGLASVPLALHYLSRKEFALWALMTSLNGYLTLIDLGMSGSISRFLIDAKDKRLDGSYGSMIKTGWTVLCVQGILLCLVSQLTAPLICAALKIEPEFYSQFLAMLRWQGLFLGTEFAARVSSQLLQAHQRYDVLNYGGIMGVLLNFSCQWAFFHAGGGVFSLVWAWMIGGLVNFSFQFVACKRLGLFPERNEWGKLSGAQFRELFSYGKDIFLVTLGSQLIMASQTMIVKRTLGLEATAMWAVGTKVFNLLTQIIWKPFDFSCAAFAEMMARGETTLLRERYRSAVILSFSFVAWAAVSFASANSLFVTLWTHGKIRWAPTNDWLLAAWMICLTGGHCYNMFVLTAKQIGFMRYVYFFEGLVFVSASFSLAPWGGVAAVIAASVMCSSLFSGAYGVFRISRHFNLPLRDVLLDWTRPMIKVLALYLPVSLLAQWVLAPFSDVVRLASDVALAVTFGVFCFLRYGVPRNSQSELLDRVPVRIASLLGHVFIQPVK